jgi:hypothetical protein
VRQFRRCQFGGCCRDEEVESKGGLDESDGFRASNRAGAPRWSARKTGTSATTERTPAR